MKCFVRFTMSVAVFVVVMAHAAWATPPLPDAKEFSQSILSTMAEYPTDGTHAYYWPKGGVWRGVTRDITYNGQVVAKGDPQGRCFCSGLTWEVLMRAIERHNRERADKVLNSWSLEDVERFRVLWFGGEDNKKCSLSAILEFGIGSSVPEPDAAQPGDFVQFWRHNGTGHSVIFLGWKRNADGVITAMEYWSTQKKTGGISRNTEPIGGKDGINLANTYIARVGQSDGKGARPL